jgi:ABC-type polysaccharide/polyol phosphate export permease
MTPESHEAAAPPAPTDETQSWSVARSIRPDAEGWVSARPPRPMEIVQRVVTFPRLALEHGDLIWTSVRRELEARFKGTLLGWFWPLVHPLFLFAVYYFIFTKLLALKMPALPAGQEAAMGVYMFSGIIVWTAFSESIMRGCNVIVENGNLIKKLAFPSEILPLNVVLVNVVTMLFAVGIFVLGCAATPIWAMPGPALAWAPLLLLLQLVFTYGLVLLLSTLQVFLRDTMQVMGVLVTIWMFVTPLFWVPEIIPGVQRFMPLIEANPMHHLVAAWRGALMGELVIPTDPPAAVVSTAAIPHATAVFAAWAVGTFLVGYGFFVLSQRKFADEV